MKLLQQLIQFILIIFVICMMISNFKSMNEKDAYNSEIEEANKYHNLTSKKINEVKQQIEKVINKTDSIMIYTNDTVNHINVYVKPNFNIEEGIHNEKYGEYNYMIDYFNTEKAINDNKKRIVNLDFFLDNINHLGFSIYHIDTTRNRNFRLTNNISDSTTYYTIAQYKYLTDKQKEEKIKYINSSRSYLDETEKKEKIKNLGKEFYDKNTIDEFELKDQKIHNIFKESRMPKFGIYKKSYYYFTCSNNYLSEEEFKEKIKLFEAMFMLKKKSYLKGKIIKAKVINFEELNIPKIKLNNKWMN